MKIIFMGTPAFAVPTLKKLIESSEVVAVYTQPDRPVGRGMQLKASPIKELALQHFIPVFQPEKLSQAGEFERIQDLNPDFIVVVAYGQILRQNILDLPKIACINIHGSLLPRWRGAAPIHWSILEGDKETGVCTMKMVQKLDAGEVYLESKVPLFQDSTTSIIHDQLSELGASLIIPTLLGLKNGTLKGKQQEESQVTYAAKLNKEMEQIHLLDSVLVCDRRVRALNPWPGTSVNLEKIGRIKVKIGKIVDSKQLASDSFIKTLKQYLGMPVLSFKDGLYELECVQLEGKKPMNAKDFINYLAGQKIELPIRFKNEL